MSERTATPVLSGHQQVAALEADVHEVVVAFCDAVHEMAAEAEALAELDHRIRAAREAAGLPAQVPTLRDHAAQVVLGALAPLRPHVPFASDHARRAAEESLRQFGAVDPEPPTRF